MTTLNYPFNRHDIEQSSLNKYCIPTKLKFFMLVLLFDLGNSLRKKHPSNYACPGVCFLFVGRTNVFLLFFQCNQIWEDFVYVCIDWIVEECVLRI